MAMNPFKTKKSAPTPEEAMKKLRETEDMLSKKSEFIESQIQAQLATAKKHGTKNKRQALQALKKKRRLEKQQEQIDNTLTTIEFQREALENATSNTTILTNMSYAAKAMKQAMGNKTEDDVHEMLDDLEEANDVAQQISEAISRPMGWKDMPDDDDLLKELEAIEQEELDLKMMATPAKEPQQLKLPDAPKNEPKRPVKSKEDEELGQLQNWAS